MLTTAREPPLVQLAVEFATDTCPTPHGRVTAGTAGASPVPLGDRDVAHQDASRVHSRPEYPDVAEGPALVALEVTNNGRPQLLVSTLRRRKTVPRMFTSRDRAERTEHVVVARG